MRRKTLLTAVLCAALAVAAQGISSECYGINYVLAESVDGTAPMSEEAGSQPSTQPGSETAPGGSGASGETGSGSGETGGSEGSGNQGGSGETGGGSGDSGNQGGSGETGGSEGSGNQGGSEGTGDSGSSGDSGSTGGTETGGTETGATEGTTPAAPTETVPTETAPTEQDFDTEIVTDIVEESEPESEDEFITNEELIARQTIVIPPDVEKEFRFTKVDKRYAIVSNPEGATVYEEKAEDAREVGTLNYYGCCYILDDQKDGWYYIESGNVRGFIRSEDVVSDEVADRIVKIKGMDELSAARLLLARTDNEAFTYTHTTVQDVMASPEYALASGEMNIYEQKKDSSRTVGTMSEGDLCYVLADAADDWVYIESGDARGFVEKNNLVTGKKAAKKVSKTGEENMPLAQVLVEPEDNKACYYTLTSVQEASQAAKTREAMVNFATQFVGNPYVWGGTSLTEGADCSGFVQTVYSYFGYSIPRVAEDQAQYGMQIPIESAEPGDLIFYARNGYVYHVSMYIGDGRVVQAAGRRVGIITSGIGGNAVWATRIIQD